MSETHEEHPTRAELRAAASPETRVFLEAMDRFRGGGCEADALDAFKTYLRATLPPPAVKLCVTGFIADTAGRILLVHHRTRGWELPGGKVEPGEPWQSALVREVREETGLDVALAEEHPRLLVGEPAPGAPFASWIALARGIAEGDPRPGDPDGLIDDARWFARDEVPLDGLSKLTSAEVVRAWASESECTGLSASWCPVHGDCTCPYEHDNPDNGRTLDDPSCPLHAPTSPHGEDAAASVTADPLPNPLLVPLSRYADALDEVARQEGCGKSTPGAYAPTAFERLAAMIPGSGPLRDAWQAFVTAREAEPLPEERAREVAIGWAGAVMRAWFGVPLSEGLTLSDPHAFERVIVALTSIALSAARGGDVPAGETPPSLAVVIATEREACARIA